MQLQSHIECNLERKLSANLRIIKGKIEENPILERNRNRKLRGFTVEKLSNLIRTTNFLMKRN